LAEEFGGQPHLPTAQASAAGAASIPTLSTGTMATRCEQIPDREPRHHPRSVRCASRKVTP
jgi:hypothetical protein